MTIGIKLARRIVVGVIGTTLIIIGAALLVLPGPGILVLAAGLTVLGLEFAFARRWLHSLRKRISEASRRARIKDSS